MACVMWRVASVHDREYNASPYTVKLHKPNEGSSMIQYQNIFTASFRNSIKLFHITNYDKAKEKSNQTNEDN